jgi:hypothetical protein
MLDKSARRKRAAAAAGAVRSALVADPADV